MHVPNDTEAFQVEHRVVVPHGWPGESRTSCFALVLAARIPRAASDGETLRTADDSVEGVELWSIDDCIVVLHQDVAACLERVEYHGSGVA